jgi:signal transduction histidine kinase
VAQPADRLVDSSRAKGRVIAIFAGAVILPSVALSVLSVYGVPRQAEAMKITMLKRAEGVLDIAEHELEVLTRRRALEAAREIGLHLLLEGRPEDVRVALEKSGYPGNMFETVRLEAASRLGAVDRADPAKRDEDVLREMLQIMGPQPGEYDENEDFVELTDSTGDGEIQGVLRFRFSCEYAQGPLLAEYFEDEFVNPGKTWVARVARPWGKVIYETEESPVGEFEVARAMKTPTFRGLKLYLRSRERSIEEEIEEWKVAKIGMVVVIDLMLGAGLLLVYSNVRREIRLSRLKSDFVANVSHELKTPLALIRLFSETLELGRVASEEKKTQYYRVINKESHRLTQLINNILDFSRIEAGRREYRFAPADLKQIIDGVVEAYRFPIEQQGFDLRIDVPEDLPRIELDEEAIGQALINLLNNAIKYSDDEKSIGIAVRRKGEGLLLSVTDRGIGVEKAEHGKIFEKFYRAEDTLVHTTRGSGLGLPLVRHIVDAHGGEVELESAPGRGSTFTVWLPLRSEAISTRGERG